MSFTDYFKPCEFGANGAQLYNGSYYRTKFGADTLQTMMTDGVFNREDETEDLRDEINRLESQSRNHESELEDTQDEIVSARG